jgi:hypothetical protein
MNWYKNFLKIAIKGTYTILASELAKKATEIVLELFKDGTKTIKAEYVIYCGTIKKSITLIIDVKINKEINDNPTIGGEYENDPTYDKNGKILDFGKEIIFLYIHIKPNAAVNRNDLYQELFYVIRHEVEHKRGDAESTKNIQENLNYLLDQDRFRSEIKYELSSPNLIDRYRGMVKHLLLSGELQPLIRSIAYSSKKRGQSFENLLRGKIDGLLYGNANNKASISQMLGITSIIQTENNIINNFINIYNNIFKRTNP